MTTLSATEPCPTTTQYQQRIQRLSLASVKKTYLPYRDIDWDAPDNQINPDDPIWAREDAAFITQTDWYRQLSPTLQRRLGLQLVVDAMGMGIFFENILIRGLLAFARNLPDGAPEYRYAMHEVIEEAQHSLMFQEFINRSGLSRPSPNRVARWGGFFATQMSKVFPVQFFIFVMCGELPIDHVQRRTLDSAQALHPLHRRIMQIHTTEEARHISFAKLYLENHAPHLGMLQRRRLAIVTPITLRIMADMMLKPSANLVKQFAIPSAVMRQAHDENAAYHELVNAAVKDIVVLCDQVGLISPAPRLWRGFGWEA